MVNLGAYETFSSDAQLSLGGVATAGQPMGSGPDHGQSGGGRTAPPRGQRLVIS